jgi:hypothetical protein
MVRKLLSVTLVLIIAICALPFNVTADIDPPAALGAPEHFGVKHNSGDSVRYTFSAPEDLRSYIEKRAADDPENKQTCTIHFQIDYKIDSGSWHHTTAWDSPKTVPDKLDDLYFTFTNGKDYADSNVWNMTAIFPEDEALKAFGDGGWDYLTGHSITFRARFAESFDGGKTYVLSPWSKEYTLSANTKADYNKLINHAPTLLSADVKILRGGEPYFELRLGRIPGDIQDLSSMSGNSVRTEIWMRRAGDKDFKYIHYEWANWEYLEIQASDYFKGLTQSYAEEGYEIKTRYALDLRQYYQSGYKDSSNSVDIYSPFSNVISHNMPAWSEASPWAATELKKADDYGLIPDSLKGADMTKPITREEFAELAVKLYEKTTGTAATAASPNPFTDTTNLEILKAFKVGVTTGTSATTFAPKELTNREQVATMLSRAIRVIAPGADFSTDGAPSFSDQKDISSWALEHVKFMSKHEIIKGTNGKFMPKATTTAEKAAGYATTTREQAIAMSVRSYEKFKGSAASKAEAAAITASITPARAAGPVVTPAQAPAVTGDKVAFGNRTAPSANSIVGVWYCFQYNAAARTAHHHYYVFCSDGTFFRGLPDNGIYNLDKSELKNQPTTSTYPDYGTYTFSGGKGEMKGNNGIDTPIVMDTKYSSLKIGNTQGFMFLPWLDNVKLDGSFTTVSPNPEGKITGDMLKREPNSIVRFSKDGTFEDRKGLLRYTGKDIPIGEEYEKYVYPGKGTYEIKDFTIIMNYDDGLKSRHKIVLPIEDLDKVDYSAGVIYPSAVNIRNYARMYSLSTHE